MTQDCSYNELFALQVLGDSMEPEFPDKCVVVIEPADRAATGAYVFVEVEGVRWFRKYVEEADGHRKLIALNELYPDIDLQGVEWKVLGIVVQRNIRRKIKHYPVVPEQA